MEGQSGLLKLAEPVFSDHRLHSLFKIIFSRRIPEQGNNSNNKAEMFVLLMIIQKANNDGQVKSQPANWA